MRRVVLGVGAVILTDCRLSDECTVLAPPEYRISNPTPREGCACDACTNGRIDAACVAAIDASSKYGGR